MWRKFKMTEYNKVKPNVKVTKEVTEEIEVKEVANREPVKKIVKNQPKKYKKGLVERLVVGLVGPDGIRAIGRQLNQEIVVPAIKNIVVDSITSGIQMAIFGEDRGGRQTSTRRPGGYSSGSQYRQQVNYARTYQTASERNSETRRSRGRGVPDDYIIATRDEAIDVLAQLRDSIDRYGQVALADYLDMIGADTTYTDETQGWVDLSRARVQAVRGGFMIVFPQMERLELR